MMTVQQLSVDLAREFSMTLAEATATLTGHDPNPMPHIDLFPRLSRLFRWGPHRG